MIKAVIFDWSGVLSDDFDATYEIGQEVLEKRGLARMSKQEYKSKFELPYGEFYKKLGKQINYDEEYALWEELWPAHESKVKPFPFAKKTLEWLNKKNLVVIVLSSRNKRSVEAEINSNGLGLLITNIYSQVSDKKNKIHSLLASHGVNEKEAVYLGDTRHDIETARYAGITSIAVLSGCETKEKLATKNPDYIIETAEKLPALIEKLNGEN